MKVDGEHGDDDEGPGKGPDPPDAINLSLELGDHIAPGGCRRLNAEAQKAQVGFGQDSGADAQRGGHNDGFNQVRQNRPQQNMPVAGADRASSKNKFPFLQRIDLGAHNPRQLHPTGQANQHDDDDDGAAQLSRPRMVMLLELRANADDKTSKRISGGMESKASVKRLSTLSTQAPT